MLIKWRSHFAICIDTQYASTRVTQLSHYKTSRIDSVQRQPLNFNLLKCRPHKGDLKHAHGQTGVKSKVPREIGLLSLCTIYLSINPKTASVKSFGAVCVIACFMGPVFSTQHMAIGNWADAQLSFRKSGAFCRALVELRVEFQPKLCVAGR